MLLCYVIDSGLSTSLLLLATLIIMFYIYIYIYEYTTFYWSAIVSIALYYTISELSDVELS